MVLDNVCDAARCIVTVTLGKEVIYQSSTHADKPIRFCREDFPLIVTSGDSQCDVALRQVAWRFRFNGGDALDYISVLYSDQSKYVASDCLSSNSGDMPIVPNERLYLTQIHFFTNFRVETNIEHRRSN
jgi:hypothetical protein